MPVEVRREVKQGEKLENKVFGHYKGLKEDYAEADSSLLSCSQIYEEECQRLGIKPNGKIREQLPKTPGRYLLYEINGACNYLGDKGVLALLPLVEVNMKLRKIKLAENGLKNDSVLPLLSFLRNNHHVISLDLSGNKPLSLEVGTQCLSLVKQNQDFMHLSLSKTSVSKAMQDNIEKQLKANRRLNGEKNMQLLKDRKRVERHQFFEMKDLFDELDVDRSGSVHLSELHALQQKKQLMGDIRHLDLASNAAVFEQIDKNGDGEVTLLEYCRAAFPGVSKDDMKHCIDCFSEFAYPEYVPPPQLSTEQLGEITSIFNVYDKNGDGKLTLAELKAGLTKSAMCIDVDAYFTDHDASGDGLLDVTEFIELMKDYYI